MKIDMIEKIAYLALKNEDISVEDMEIIQYGLDSLLSKIINILSILPVVLYMGVGKEYFLFLLLFGTLRTKVGGYHAETRARCFIFSYIMVLFAMIGTKFWIIYNLAEKKWRFILLLLLMEAIIYILAPIDTENKRLSKGEKKYYKKMCARWLSFMDMVLIISLYMGNMTYAYVMQVVLICLLFLLLGGIVKNALLRKKRYYSINK